MNKSQQAQTTNRIPGINYTKQGNPILTDKTPYQTRQNIVDSYKTLHEQTTRKITELKESAERQVRELEAEQNLGKKRIKKTNEKYFYLGR